MQGIHRFPVDSPHKGPETLTILPYHDTTFRDRCRYQTHCGRVVQERDVRYLQTPTSAQWWSIKFSVDNILTHCPRGRCGSKIKSIIFKLIVQNSSLDTRCEIGLNWMPKNVANEKSILARVVPRNNMVVVQLYRVAHKQGILVSKLLKPHWLTSVDRSWKITKGNSGKKRPGYHMLFKID